MKSSALYQLLAYVIGEAEAASLLDKVQVDPDILRRPVRGDVDRAVIAQALCLNLYFDLLRRVASARRYLNEVVRPGEKVTFDRCLVRTIRLPGMGPLPAGEAAVSRLLRPLGYVAHEADAVPAGATAERSFVHADFPRSVPQIVVREVALDGSSERFQAAAARVFGASRDPVTPELRQALGGLQEQGSLPFHDAANVVLFVSRCFDRQHQLPTEDDYRVLLEESVEVAWLASEGNAIDQATDSVSDLPSLHARLRSAGFDVAPDLEVSADGRTRRTALRPDPVTRRFTGRDGGPRDLCVPGSCYGFVERRA